MTPHDYPKRILLCATGRYPQVITETLYALITQRQFVPTEIHALGTVPAKEGILRDLLTENSPYHALCQEFGLEGKIRFDEGCIHTIASPDGRELDDILYPEEISIMADVAVDIIRSLCQDADSCLHVSIAGGRKTLSFIVGYALSLFARPQDILSHVLVPGGYEYNRDFFYPSQQQQDLTRWNAETKETEPLLARDANIMLADIPLVHLRSNLPANFLTTGTYSQTVSAIQYSLKNPATMQFNLEESTIVCDEETIDLQPAPFIMLLWLAVRKKKGLAPIHPAIDSTLVQEYQDFSDNIVNHVKRARDVRNLSHEDFVKKFNETRTIINKAIQKALPQEERWKRYQIDSTKRKGYSAYELSIPSEGILLPKGIN